MSQANTWIFQANPNKYRIEESLQWEKEEYWNLNQHRKKVKAGDRVLVWISGANAGIYASGVVVTDPIERPDSPEGLSYWYKPNDGAKVKPRVLVRYDKIFLEKPLLKLFLINDPDLWSLDVIKSPRGTNFKVNPTQWENIEKWLEMM